VLIPSLIKAGYGRGFSAALTAAANVVGPIIPPSISFVLIASIANISVGQLFLAGVLPGFLMTASMLLLTYVIARIKGFPVEPRAGWAERLDAVARAALPLMAPLRLRASERLMTRLALLTMSPLRLPEVPALPSCKVPAVMVVVLV
jgi:C4-dicarboxylate transporter DctM subunit